MNTIDQWSFKWFGVWREYGPKYKDCPSIREFVSPELVAHYDKKRLGEFLLNGQIVASTSRANFPCPFTGTRHPGTLSFRTDGKWLWLDDLPDYIENFAVAIPSKWLRSIESGGYEIRPVTDHEISTLQWPPIAP